MISKLLAKQVKLVSPFSRQMKKITTDCGANLEPTYLFFKDIPTSKIETWSETPVRPYIKGENFGAWLEESSSSFMKNFHASIQTSLKKKQADEDTYRDSSMFQKELDDFLALPKEKQSALCYESFKCVLKYEENYEAYRFPIGENNS